MLADRYELGDVLGEGGMGRVVAAHDLVLQRDVAVKLLTGASDSASRARFLREARDSARLRHPNAVTVFDTGEHDGQPFIVMELVRGITLDELVARDGPLDVEVAVAITVGVLEALAAAHGAGLVHRDVKPGNVILPDDGGVKLSDFGIAKAMDEATASLTAVGTVLGTPAYLAPELVDGGAATYASDLYAVGCMLYMQLTGAPPFTAETPLAIAYAHVNREVPSLEERRPDVPDELRRVLLTALAKDPAERYPDAAAMRTALLGGVPAASPREATLPLTVALSSGSPAAAGSGEVRHDADAAPADAAGSVRHAESDPTVVIGGDRDTGGARSRPPWKAFALGAVLLVALVALAVAWPFGGDDPVEESEMLEEPDDTDPAEPEPDDPDPAEPDPVQPDAPDEPGETEEPEQPAPEPDAPEDDEAPEQPPAEEEPPAEEDPPADDDPGPDDGGQGPDGDGPPGQNGPPGQED